MKGYCRECHELVPIVARELRPGNGRQRNWYPLDHEVWTSDGGWRVCPGTVKPL